MYANMLNMYLCWLNPNSFLIISYGKSLYMYFGKTKTYLDQL